MGCVWVYMEKVELRYWWEYSDEKTLEQKFIFQIGTLNPIGVNKRFSFY